MLQRGQAAELDAVDVLRDDAWNMRHWWWLVLALPPVPSFVGPGIYMGVSEDGDTQNGQ